MDSVRNIRNWLTPIELRQRAVTELSKITCLSGSNKEDLMYFKSLPNNLLGTGFNL